MSEKKSNGPKESFEDSKEKQKSSILPKSTVQLVERLEFLELRITQLELLVLRIDKRTDFLLKEPDLHGYNRVLRVLASDQTAKEWGVLFGLTTEEIITRCYYLGVKTKDM